MHPGPEALVQAVLETYTSLRFAPPGDQFTVLASIFLSSQSQSKIIAIATGTKCLPTSRLPTRGEAIHDSHAEALVRRAALRWFFEEILRIQLQKNFQSDWIALRRSRKFSLREGVKINLYVSTVPCGDASTRFLASFQDPVMANLKDTTPHSSPSVPNTASRGRNNYSLYGVLRTKPGRADSPPTSCMSCSDKIAKWNFLGIQGALGSELFETPLYLNNVVIGEVEGLDMRKIVREDCERAFWGRLLGIQESTQHSLHRPSICFTEVPFTHSKCAMNSGSSCNESLCWVADSTRPHEVLINGFKRGVAPKHRYRENTRPSVSRSALFHLYCEITYSEKETYLELKRNMASYNEAKVCLLGPDGPFSGWIRSDAAERQHFNRQGELVPTGVPN